MDSIFSGFSQINDDFYDELEETLIMGDIGVRTTMEILDQLREKAVSYTHLDTVSYMVERNLLLLL